ncbi:uncharacterized protein TNCV_3374871 [Trichonephila clavipes]|nr:uncharacterized protein TNCV_3374871 [Trichonephila clavipes]
MAIRSIPLIFSLSRNSWVDEPFADEMANIKKELESIVTLKLPVYKGSKTYSLYIIADSELLSKMGFALWAGGIIGPYFFKNDEGHNVTVNGDRYRAMITNFFTPKLNNHDVQELWFQQDGATCHIARATIDLLKKMFGDRLISRFGPVNWPPRSCD